MCERVIISPITSTATDGPPVQFKPKLFKIPLTTNNISSLPFNKFLILTNGTSFTRAFQTQKDENWCVHCLSEGRSLYARTCI